MAPEQILFVNIQVKKRARQNGKSGSRYAIILKFIKLMKELQNFVSPKLLVKLKLQKIHHSMAGSVF